ncbi:hypothetical protein CKY47_30240 [Saccharothrix yanglingensis]|uniref:Uncharacterized protein n=1 Tax=Saccharothrix yanglingensis TaxID=659496 RepID=A0ABU0X873_9PSEU|nr:hypothetical protein [Saccharothrix yanglingensis]
MTLRQFRWTTRTGPDDLPLVYGIAPYGDLRKLPVDVADVILVNAMAPTASLRIEYATRVDELRLLRSCLLDKADGALHLAGGGFASSSPHVRRFVSESFGLGMLSAAVQSAYEWVAGPDALRDFDALPVSLARKYAKSRVRPDLLFRTADLLLAGEARGRSSRPAASTLQQEKRLNTLLPWVDAHKQPLVMTWAHLTEAGVTVNLYSSAEGGSWLDAPIGESRPPSSNLYLDVPTEDVPTEDVPADDVPAGAAGDARAPVDPDGPPGAGPDAERPPPRSTGPGSAEAMFSAGRETLPLLTRQLYASAPETPVRLADRRLRGRWVPVDPVHPDRGTFLLGVLEEPLSPRDGRVLTERLRARNRDVAVAGGVTVAVRDRLLVATSALREGQPWDLLVD